MDSIRAQNYQPSLIEQPDTTLKPIGKASFELNVIAGDELNPNSSHVEDSTIFTNPVPQDFQPTGIVSSIRKIFSNIAQRLRHKEYIQT